jgi:transposase-like protein
LGVNIAKWGIPNVGLQRQLTFGAQQEAEARRRLRMSNVLEQEHQEVRYRTSLIDILRNEAGSLHLTTTLAQDHPNQWTKLQGIIPASSTHPVKGIPQRACRLINAPTKYS